MEEIDTMEDSGFDSDPKSTQNGSSNSPVQLPTRGSDANALKALRKSTDLQKKIERQREVARKAQQMQQATADPLSAKKSASLLSRSRLVVPTKYEAPSVAPDQQPLVMLETDDSEDEFVASSLSKTAQREITQQLIKDGYNLDLEPDDEDLDLIPPRPLNERCICCNTQLNCAIQ